MNTPKWLLLLACAVLSAFYHPSPGLAGPILDAELASFAVLSASTGTNTGPTVLTGNLGVSPGSAITGFFGTMTNEGPGTVIGTVHEADAFANSAQTQLATARTNLGLLGPGTTLALADLTLAGSLAPGIYTVPEGVSNLTGTLTLDGGGNANAFWVFQMQSTLITSSGSVVNVINTGAGAGLYWNVASSATLDTSTSFAGNILALASITLNNSATIGCGRALAQNGAVTMQTNTISTGCVGVGATSGEGSFGFSGGDIASVPEPATWILLATGVAGLLAYGWRRQRTA